MKRKQKKMMNDKHEKYKGKLRREGKKLKHINVKVSLS